MSKPIEVELEAAAEVARDFYRRLSEGEAKAAFNNQTLIGTILLVEKLGEIQEELEGIGIVLELINKKLTQP